MDVSIAIESKGVEWIDVGRAMNTIKGRTRNAGQWCLSVYSGFRGCSCQPHILLLYKYSLPRFLCVWLAMPGARMLAESRAVSAIERAQMMPQVFAMTRVCVW